MKDVVERFVTDRYKTDLVFMQMEEHDETKF